MGLKVNKIHVYDEVHLGMNNLKDKYLGLILKMGKVSLFVFLISP
jgi:hypothetical protein